MAAALDAGLPKQAPVRGWFALRQRQIAEANLGADSGGGAVGSKPASTLTIALPTKPCAVQVWAETYDIYSPRSASSDAEWGPDEWEPDVGDPWDALAQGLVLGLPGPGLDLDFGFREEPEALPRWPPTPQTPLFQIGTPPPELEDDLCPADDADDDFCPAPSPTHSSALEDHATLDGQEGDTLGSDARERRRLNDVLWLARPMWEPKDLVVAEKKLAKVGITSVWRLADVLARGELTRLLRQSGVQTFKEETLQQFQLRAHEALANPDFQASLGMLGGEASPSRRFLCDVLWAARPTWTPQDLERADKKLAAIGVEDVATLDEYLEDLNAKLRKAGQKAFARETLAAIRRHIDKACGREAPEGPSRAELRSALRGLLSESKPDWSASELDSVQKKLGGVGVTSLDTLREAIAEGLNERLREKGLRTFSGQTMRAIEHRLESHGDAAKLRAKTRGGADR